MTKKNTPYTLDKPTRKFVEFFYWLKKGMNFYPDICIDVGHEAGTPSIIQSFTDAKHYIFTSSPSLSAQLQQSISNIDHEIFDMVLKDKRGNAHGAGEPASTLDHELGDVTNSKAVLLKTHCQGEDLLVLEGGKELLKDCDVVIIRTAFYRFRGGQSPDFYDVVDYMKQKDFVVFDILNGTFRPTNRALGQVDLAFVKKNGPMRPHHRW
jgi:Methyltransferase FkbM domain